jgi:VCBS repeat-containing protein
MDDSDDAHRSLATGVDPRDGDRYGAFELAAEGAVIYDVENDAAWIQSDVATTLSARR